MATWSSAYVTALPNSAFACIDSSGRHYPHHNSSGAVDLPHLRAALSRIGDPANTQCGKGHLEAHAKAAGIGMKEPDYLKAEQLGTSKWRVLAIPFGGPFRGGKDLDGEYFSPATDVKSSWFPTRPVLWHHGGDRTIKDDVLGTEDDLTKEDDGWWATVWLDRSARYWDRVSSLLAAGKVFGSSGALGHLVKKAPDGEILVWPHIEQTLTPTPSNPFSRVVPTKAVDLFTFAGLELEPAVRALLDEDTYLEPDLPSGGEDPARIARARAQVAALIARSKIL